MILMGRMEGKHSEMLNGYYFLLSENYFKGIIQIFLQEGIFYLQMKYINFKY